MAATEDSLAVALHQLERVLRDQLVSIGALSTKASVLLGFSITAAGSVVALDRASLVAHPGTTSLSVAFLLVASAVFAHCYRMASYSDPPSEDGLLRLLESPVANLRRKLIASFADAIRTNRKTIEARFRRMNAGLAWLLVGIVIYAVGVGLW